MRPDAADVLVQGKLRRFGCRLSAGKRCAQNGVCAERTLVVGAIDLEHRRVDSALILGLEADKGLSDFLVDMGHSVQNALAHIAMRVAIAQFDSLECARRRTGGNRSATERAVVKRHFNLNRRVSARVENLTPEYVDDHAHAKPP